MSTRLASYAIRFAVNKTLDSSLSDKWKSIILTIITFGLLLLLLFFIRFWPPANLKELIGGGGGGGIEMNFGDSDFGMGDNYKSEVVNVKDEIKSTPIASTPQENIITDDDATNTDVAMNKKETTKKTPVEVKREVKPVVEKPKVSKNANDAMANLLNGNKGGDGNDGKAGNKGSANGNLNSKGYYGNGSGTGSGGGNGSGKGTGSGSGTGTGNGSGNGGGNGSGSGYSLGNRKALSKPEPINVCGNESGRVVVQVTVDKNGNTISVVAGIQGTTNTNSCLLKISKKAAMETRWQPDPNAPEKQVGKIIYNFNLN